MSRFALLALAAVIAPKGCEPPPVATGPNPPTERSPRHDPDTRYNPPPLGDPTRGEGRFTSSPEVSQPADECVDAQNSSSCYGEACDHMITVTNNCEAEVKCELSTDKDPGWLSVQLVPAQVSRLTTRHGADNDEFEIRLKCEYYY